MSNFKTVVKIAKLRVVIFVRRRCGYKTRVLKRKCLLIKYKVVCPAFIVFSSTPPTALPLKSSNQSIKYSPLITPEAPDSLNRSRWLRLTYELLLITVIAAAYGTGAST